MNIQAAVNRLGDRSFGSVIRSTPSACSRPFARQRGANQRHLDLIDPNIHLLRLERVNN